jgi:dUTPase
MSKESFYEDGFTLAFTHVDYNLIREYIPYILRGYSDIKDEDNNYYFSISYKNGYAHYMKPLGNHEDCMLLEMLTYVGIPFQIEKDEDEKTIYSFRGSNFIDYIHTIFSENMSFPHPSQDLFERFLKNHGLCKPEVNFTYTLNHHMAIPPSKSRFSDTGYDLCIVEEKKRIGRTIIYDTGVCVKPSYGYYFDVVPRSSISKMGYFQTNSVGIIDCAYRGTIHVALTKMDDLVADLDLPCRIAQLIPRKLELVGMVETEFHDNTNRGVDGGIAR